MTQDIATLQKELLKKEKTEEVLRKRVSIYHNEVLGYRKRMKTLIEQYESVVGEQRKIIRELMNNAPKLFALYLNKKFHAWKEGRR